MTTPSYTAASGTAAINTSVTLTAPATINTGDTLLLFVWWQTNATLDEIRFGGTNEIGDWTIVEDAVSDTNNAQQVHCRVFTKEAAGTEDGQTVRVVFSGYIACQATLIRFSDAEAVDVSDAQEDSSADVATSPAVTSTVTDGRIFRAYAANTFGDSSSGFTLTDTQVTKDSVNNLRLALETSAASSTSVPSQTSDAGLTGRRHVGVTVVVRAAGSTVTVNPPTLRSYFSVATPSIATSSQASAPPAEVPVADSAPAPLIDFRIFVRDENLNRVAEVADFVSFTATKRHRGIGAWVLIVDGDASVLDHISQPGERVGVEVRLGGQTWLTGRVDTMQRSWDGSRERVTIAGPDDLALLRDRIIVPQPGATGPPYTVSHYEASGDAGAVLRNLIDAHVGAAAATGRSVSDLTVAAAPTNGTDVAVRYRFSPLWEAVRELCVAHGMGVRCTSEAGAYTVTVVNDGTSDVIFGDRLGNVASYELTTNAPEATRVIGLGAGEDAAREVLETQASSASTYGRREVTVDARQSETSAQLSDRVDEEIAARQAVVSVQVDVIDGRPWLFGSDYDLGDTVTARVSGVEVSAPVVEVSVSVARDAGVRVRPVIGETTLSPLAVFDRVAGLEARLRRLEGAA